MVKSINIEEMLERECSDLARTGEDFRRHEIVMDTNAFKYRWVETDFRYMVSSGIFNELERYSKVFPEEAIRDLGILLNPGIITKMVSAKDEKEIIESARLYAKSKLTLNRSKGPRKKNRENGDIGWADVQQISYAMQRARNREKTIIISDDGDILGTVKYLRKRHEYMRKNVRAISVRRYLERSNEDFLRGHEGYFRRALVGEIASQYK